VWQRLAAVHADEHINLPLVNDIHIVEANGGQRWPLSSQVKRSSVPTRAIENTLDVIITG
jgi:hypothetical protein